MYLLVVALRMDYGLWTENSRGTYNKWDGVARSTIQVSLDVLVNVKLDYLMSSFDFLWSADFTNLKT